jgi:hypothetical protein
MQTQTGDVAVTVLTSASDLASWNIERTTEQLLGFINAKHSALPDDIDL